MGILPPSKTYMHGGCIDESSDLDKPEKGLTHPFLAPRRLKRCRLARVGKAAYGDQPCHRIQTQTPKMSLRITNN